MKHPDYNSDGYIGAKLVADVRFSSKKVPDILNNQSILFRFERPDGTKFSRTGYLYSDGSDGKAKCTFVAGNLDVKGEYYFDIKITFSPTVILTTPNKGSFVVG